VALHDDREWVAELYRTYGPAIYRRCLRLLGDREAARDATQEVFGKVMREAAKLAGIETALPWIYRVATNHCLNLRRNSSRRGEQPLPELDLPEVDGADFSERHLARQVLARFDTKTQAIALGVYVDGMEHEEVATALGISRRTVSRKLERFLVNARKFLLRSET
jgi:RNA polymerase sigma-70 factor (ECF subfamily)